MSISIKDNCFYLGKNKISNFTIKKLDEKLFEIDNGTSKRQLTIQNINDFARAKESFLREGYYIFWGTKYDYRALMKSLNNN